MKWASILCLGSVLGAGCFPPVKATSEDTAGVVDTASAADTAAADAAVSDTVDPATGDSAGGDTGDAGGAHPCPAACPPAATACKVSRCDTTAGECVEVDADDGAECDDGRACTVGDKCVGGACLSTPNACDDGVACTVDRCAEPGGCVHDGQGCPCGPGVSCDDHNPCNGVETCDEASFTCVAGAALPANVPCDDGLVCTGDDRCRGGVCSGLPVSCDDGLECSPDRCDEGLGGCVSDTSTCVCEDDSGCPDANLCDGRAYCDKAANACAPGTPVTCQVPANLCQRAACVAATGECNILDKDAGTPCDDGSVCTATSTCQAGHCEGASPIPCPASDSCHESVGCDPTAGCLEVPKTDGTPCQTAAGETGSCHAAACKRLPIVVAGGFHTCAILADDTLKCWGSNAFGELGQGNTDDNGGTATVPFTVKNVPPVLTDVVSASAGNNITCAVTKTGQARCWGYNGVESLGYGDQLARGATSDTLPALLDPVPVGSQSSSVTTQGYRTCVRTALSKVRCWGGGSDYPGLDSVGTEWGPSIATAGDIAVDATLKVVEIANSNFGTSCALLENRRIRCWGNSAAVVGLPIPQIYGDDEPPKDAPIINPDWEAVSLTGGSAHACALSAAGPLLCWGYNGNFELGLGDTDTRATPTQVPSPVEFTSASAGGNHSCGLSADGAVRCWGGGAFGQNGNASTTNVESVPDAAINLGGPAARISAGWGYTCAVLADGDVRCWGINDHRQLGISGEPTPLSVGGQEGDMPPTAVELY